MFVMEANCREDPERLTTEYFACPNCEEMLDWELDLGGDCCPVCGCAQLIDPSVVPASQQYNELQPVRLMMGEVQLVRDA